MISRKLKHEIDISPLWAYAAWKIAKRVGFKHVAEQLLNLVTIEVTVEHVEEDI